MDLQEGWAAVLGTMDSQWIAETRSFPALQTQPVCSLRRQVTIIVKLTNKAIHLVVIIPADARPAAGVKLAGWQVAGSRVRLIVLTHKSKNGRKP